MTEPFDRLDELSPAALRRWWTRRLRRMLEIAERELPFYEERFRAVGFRASDLRSLDDLRALPVWSKKDFLAVQARTRSHALGIERIAGRPRANTLTLSSGTSGTTFITINSRWRKVQGRSSARGHWWAGLRPGGALAISAPAWHNYAAIQPYLAEHYDLQCVIVAGTYLPRFADRIVDAFHRFRPRFVTMFLPMVFPILAAGRRIGLEPRALFDGVETLLVTGAPITPGMRDHLLRTLGVGRVTEVAGTSEGVLAVECREGSGLHVVPDTCYVEVLGRSDHRPVAAGERGTMVHSYLIPEGSVYLRFDSEDVATLDSEPCACGLPSPRLKIVGRWENSFALGGETVLPFDVQLALESALPELIGTPFVIVREALAAGKLRLLLPEPDGGGARLGEAIRAVLERRFASPAEADWVPELPVQFKGVAPVLSEKQIG